MIFPGFFEHVEASYNANTGQVFGEVALPLAHANIAYEPFAGLAWVGVDTGASPRAGGDAALTSGGSQRQRRLHEPRPARGGLDVRWWRRRWCRGPPPLGCTPSATSTRMQGLAFATFGQSFVVSGVPLAQDSALIDAGFDVVLGPTRRRASSTPASSATHVQDNAVSGRVNWRF